MTNIDLTKLDRPLGEYDIETQVALFRAHRKGGEIEYHSDTLGGFTLISNPSFQDNVIYRLKPEPTRDIDLPWSVIDDRWQWAARDEDGSVFVFTGKPNEDTYYWSMVEDDDEMFDATYALKHDPGNKPWNESLIKRPENT